MKTLIAILALTFSISTFACTPVVTNQPFPYVKLSEFGIYSFMDAIKPPMMNQPSSFDFSHCQMQAEKRIGTPYVEQKFPSVPLSLFNRDSWMVAK